MAILHHYPFCPHSRFVRLSLAEIGLEPELQRGAALGAPDRVPGHQPGRARRPCSSTSEARRAGRRRSSRNISTRRAGSASAAAACCPTAPAAAGRGAPAARLVPRQVPRGGHGLSGHREDLQALHAARAGGGPPDMSAIRAARTNVRYHLKYIGYLIATRNWLAGDRSDLCGSRGGGPSLAAWIISATCHGTRTRRRRTGTRG